MFLIYKHTFNNGKSYIGYTSKTLEKRLEEHISAANNGSTTKFHKAIRKYGSDTITSECLIDSIETKEQAKLLEIESIEKYNTFGRNSNGYNMTKGGDGNSLFGEENGMYGKTHSNKTKEKLSLLASNRTGEKNGMHKSNRTDEERKNHAIKIAEIRKENGTYSSEYNGMTGNTHTKEARVKISIAAKERIGEKNSFYGKAHSVESREKISKSKKGKTHERVLCKFCENCFGVNNIQRHERSCSKNPNKIKITYNKS